MYEIHIIPIDDLRGHDESFDCWCNPERDDIDPELVIHNSMDGREAYETGKRQYH
jgi:hypothetical protein